MKEKYKEDYDFIHGGCKAIRSGNKAAIELFLKEFIDCRGGSIDACLTDFGIRYDLIEDARQDFLIYLWSNDGKRLSNYEGDALLKTYL
jgi:hypothetical protein